MGHLGLSCWLALATIALPFVTPLAAHATPSPDDEVRGEVQRAQALIKALEMQHAREILEAVLTSPAWRRAAPRARARLWVVLGRARAETGDLAGMSQAFENATRLDRSVALPAQVSPKILGALEDARAKVPLPEADPRVAPRARERMSGTDPSVVLRADEPEDRRVLVWAELSNVPEDARLDARRRIGSEGPWTVLTLIRTGTVALVDLPQEPLAQSLYIEVRAKQRLLARDGTPEAPALRIPGWAEPPPPSPAATTSTRSSTVALAAEAPPPSDGGLSTLGLALIIGGAVLLVVVGATVAVATSGGGSGCAAPTGFGCAEIRVPLGLGGDP